MVMDITENISFHIAAILGPVLIVLSVSEYLNLEIWRKVDATVVYLNGLFFLVAGMLLVRFHNLWTAGWPVIITILGWLILLLGMVRMFFPKARQMTDKRGALPILVLLLVTGIFLTVQAYA